MRMRMGVVERERNEGNQGKREGWFLFMWWEKKNITKIMQRCCRGYFVVFFVGKRLHFFSSNIFFSKNLPKENKGPFIFDKKKVHENSYLLTNNPMVIK